MKKSNWFVIKEKEKKFVSKNSPTSLEEAWGKTMEKWNLILKGYVSDEIESESCGLCNLFLSDNCKKCPIYKYTGRPYCRETPFMDYSKKADNDLDYWSEACKELEFLNLVKEVCL